MGYDIKNIIVRKAAYVGSQDHHKCKKHIAHHGEILRFMRSDLV